MQAKVNGATNPCIAKKRFYLKKDGSVFCRFFNERVVKTHLLKLVFQRHTVGILID